MPRANTRTARKSPETTFHVFNRGANYKFSSHRYYAANGDDRSRWLDVETGLAAFGGQARYLEFLNEFVNADRQISY